MKSKVASPRVKRGSGKTEVLWGLILTSWSVILSDKGGVVINCCDGLNFLALRVKFFLNTITEERKVPTISKYR